MKSTYKTFGIIILILIGVVLFLSKEKYPSSSSPLSSSSKEQIVIAFSPNPIPSVIDEGSAHLTIDTGENIIKFIQIKFSYNPLLIYDIQIKKSNEFADAEVLNNFIDDKKGTATLILDLSKSKNGFKGKGNIAAVSFKTYLRRGEKTNVTFTKETMVTNNTAPNALSVKTIDTHIIRKR